MKETLIAILKFPVQLLLFCIFMPLLWIDHFIFWLKYERLAKTK